MIILKNILFFKIYSQLYIYIYIYIYIDIYNFLKNKHGYDKRILH